MKFFNLLKKELRELMTAQTIATMFISLLAFYLVGNLMGGIMEDITEKATEVYICDLDNSEFTQTVISDMKAAKASVKMVELKTDDYVAELEDLGLTQVIVIPEDFTKTVLEDKKPAKLMYYSTLETLAMTSTISSAGSQAGVEIITDSIKKTLMLEKFNFAEISQIENPVALIETTIVGGKSAQISASALSSLATMQGVFVPIVIFILILYSSQMIISAISTEKIDKTLETLLSAPVSRMSVLTSKMLASAVVAALNAAVYMLGFSQFMDGMMGGSMDSTPEYSQAMVDLGLKLSTTDYFLLGIQMFFTILIALSISLILGALAKDVKSAQSLIMPIMFLAMIPYMLTMFVDLSTLPTIIKGVIYAIPFTHTFTAIDNIIFAKDTLFWGGVIYQIAVLIICMFFAIKLFTSDKIFTLTLDFSKLKRKRKAQIPTE